MALAVAVIGGGLGAAVYPALIPPKPPAADAPLAQIELRLHSMENELQSIRERARRDETPIAATTADGMPRGGFPSVAALLSRIPEHLLLDDASNQARAVLASRWFQEHALGRPIELVFRFGTARVRHETATVRVTAQPLLLQINDRPCMIEVDGQFSSVDLDRIGALRTGQLIHVRATIDAVGFTVQTSGKMLAMYLTIDGARIHD